MYHRSLSRLESEEPCDLIYSQLLKKEGREGEKDNRNQGIETVIVMSFVAFCIKTSALKSGDESQAVQTELGREESQGNLDDYSFHGRPPPAVGAPYAAGLDPVGLHCARIE